MLSYITWADKTRPKSSIPVNKRPSAKQERSPFKSLISGGQKILNTVQAFALACLLNMEVKTLLLNTYSFRNRT